MGTLKKVKPDTANIRLQEKITTLRMCYLHLL